MPDGKKIIKRTLKEEEIVVEDQPLIGEALYKAISDEFNLALRIEPDRFTSDPRYRQAQFEIVEAIKGVRETKESDYNKNLFDAFVREYNKLEGLTIVPETPKVEKTKSTWDDIEKMVEDIRLYEEKREKGYADREAEIKRKEVEIVEKEQLGKDIEAEKESIKKARRSLKNQRNKDQRELNFKLEAIVSALDPIGNYTTHSLLKTLSKYDTMKSDVLFVGNASNKKIEAFEDKLAKEKDSENTTLLRLFDKMGLKKTAEVWRQLKNVGFVNYPYENIVRAMVELDGYRTESVEALLNKDALKILELARVYRNPDPVPQLVHDNKFSELVDLAEKEKIIEYLEQKKRKYERKIHGDEKFKKKYKTDLSTSVENYKQIIEIAKRDAELVKNRIPVDDLKTTIKASYWLHNTIEKREENLFSTHLLEPVREALVESEILSAGDSKEEAKSIELLRLNQNHRANIRYKSQRLTIEGEEYETSIPLEGTCFLDVTELTSEKVMNGEYEGPVRAIPPTALKGQEKNVHFWAIYNEIAAEKPRYKV